MFDNLVKFVYKYGKNWQRRAWDTVFKTAVSAPDAAMILGLFTQNNLKINIELRPNKKICVFTVTRPTLIFVSDPMHFYTEFG